MPSAGIFINLPDCACIKKLFSDPVWEGEFLNFDCSVSHKSPPLPGVPPPPPQGMADDKCIIHSPPVGRVLLHLPTKDDEFFEEGFGFFL